MKDLRSHFGMRSLPFTRELPVKDRFELSFFDETLDGMLGPVEQRMSVALIAPAGTGKTQLLRALMARLPEARYDVRYVKVTDLSKRDMCRELAAAIGVEPAGNYPTLLRRLQDRFLTTYQAEALRPVLIVDEAHGIRRAVLSMLCILTNFEMDSRLVLSVVLSGQPPLARALRRDDTEDVARRIAYYGTLRPLSRDETNSYVAHRCTIAGAKSVPFDSAALDAIYEIGRGNLRATDNLGLESLNIARRHRAKVAGANHVAEARKVLWP